MASYKYFAFLLFLLIPFVDIFSQEFTMPSFVHAIDACDMDMDGSIDIVVSCAYEDSIVILFNDGYGNFELYYYGRNTQHLLCGCIDGDSIPDIITFTEGYIFFIKNNGNRTLEQVAVVYDEGNTYPLDQIIDLNNDGWKDLLFDVENYWGVFKNNGDLTFSKEILGSNNATQVNPSTGFLNDDDLPDILISYDAKSRSEVTQYLVNSGNFNFSINILSNVCYYTPAISELDNTFPDDLSLFNSPTNEVYLYENTGNANFILKSIHFINNSAGVYLANEADYNCDGFDDFCYIQCLWTGCTDSLYIELNDQNWSYEPAEQYYIGTLNWFRIKSVDLNGDSYPDFYMTGYNSNNKIKILWNNGDGTFSYLNPVGINNNKRERTPILMTSPNPFQYNTSISFRCENLEKVTLKVIDMHGVVIKHLLANQNNSAGIYQCNWTGTNDLGEKCSPGIYVIVLEINKNQYSCKVIYY